MARARQGLKPAAWIGGGALALWLLFRHGFANYDTFYSLVWGNEIFHGHSPDYGAALPPTPHPLATAFGVIAAPLGDGAQTAAVVAAFVSLAAIGYLVYRLGELWLNRWVGLLAAAIVLTREPILDYGSRAYVDLPYIALVLAALVVEIKRPRAGWPVLALLGLTGLLRPEAWLFAGAYLLYLAYADPERPNVRFAPIGALFDPGALLPLTALAAVAPLAWALFDLALTGDPLYSLTGTQDTVTTLDRPTGLFDALRLAPRRIGEILREPVLLGAALGAVLTIWKLRKRSALMVAAAVIAAGAFLLLATAGLAVITRYLLLVSTILALFAAAGVLGWLELDRDDPSRRLWAAGAAVVVLATLVFAPQQFNRLSDLQARVGDQEQIRDDLQDVTEEPAFDRDCAEVSIPSTQGVPLLALWLDREPSEISTSGTPPSGYLIAPVNGEVAELFRLDEHDPAASSPAANGINPRIAATASNSSWLVFGSCG